MDSRPFGSEARNCIRATEIDGNDPYGAKSLMSELGRPLLRRLRIGAPWRESPQFVLSTRAVSQKNSGQRLTRRFYSAISTAPCRILRRWRDRTGESGAVRDRPAGLIEGKDVINHCFQAAICCCGQVGRVLMCSLAFTLLVTGAEAAARDDGSSSPPPSGVQSYVITGFKWAVYQTPETTTECPEGMNAGPREQIKAQFPNAVGGQTAPGKMTLEELFIKREAANFWPQLADKDLDPLPWKDARGTVSYGLNLDGKVGPNDFTSPDGEPGIDNQLFRAIGCVNGFRETGTFANFGDLAARSLHYDRILIELTGVDNLTNSEHVNVTFYRGLDSVVMDGAGKPLTHTTQHIDVQRGAIFVHSFHGRIVNGVLTTDPADLVIPWQSYMGYSVEATEWLHAARLKLKLTPDGAEGLIAGYADVDTFFDAIARSRDTQISRGYTNTALYRALHRLADGYPDPVTGANTAISCAIKVTFVQAYVEHPTVAGVKQNHAGI